MTCDEFISYIEERTYGATNNGKREGAFFDCSLHWKHKDKCGTHFIRESVLERMVLKHIQFVMRYILRYRQHFIFVMEQQLQLESAEKLQTRISKRKHSPKFARRWIADWKILQSLYPINKTKGLRESPGPFLLPQKNG